jgi:methyltransferase
MSLLYAILLLVVAQRLTELVLARANTAQLLAQGAIEIDAGGYPFLVALHAAWLLAIAATVPAASRPSWPLLCVFGLLQLARIWVIASLGRRWTTRIIVLPGAPLVRTGPYRWCRHPNYLVVAAEIAVLPLAFGAVALALAFSAINLLLLARRIALEERALAIANANGYADHTRIAAAGWRWIRLF